MGERANGTSASRQRELYEAAVSEFRAPLQRLALSYEFDADKRRDLMQEILFQLWRSLAVFDDRCSLRTWTFRVAHNAAVSYMKRERRAGAALISLEEIERTASVFPANSDIDRTRALERLTILIASLKPLDRQVMFCYLEEMDSSAIAEITGLSPANVLMKIHRIKAVLARRFHREQHHA